MHAPLVGVFRPASVGAKPADLMVPGGPLKPDQAGLVILSCLLGIEEREGAQPWGRPQSDVGGSTEKKLRETERGAEDRATTHSFLHSFVHQVPLTLATARIVLETSS